MNHTQFFLYDDKILVKLENKLTILLEGSIKYLHLIVIAILPLGVMFARNLTH